MLRKKFLTISAQFLRFLASSILNKRRPLIIGITGSVAKSSTKEAVFAVLQKKFHHHIAKSAGNLNTEIGVPLAILGIQTVFPSIFFLLTLLYAFIKWVFLFFFPRYPQVLVLEMAADKPGDIEYLCSFIKPNVGIITLIGPAHLESFKTLEGVAQEKGKLIESLDAEGMAVLNKQDSFSSSLAKRTRARVVYFVPRNGEIASVVARKLGEIFSVPKKAIEEALSSLSPLPGRMNLIPGMKNSLILFDAYNANPISVEYALRQLSALSDKFRKSRKIAVLGDMLELGGQTEEFHRLIGEKAKEKVDLLVCTGEKGRIIAQAGKGRYFCDKEEVINFLKQIIQENDIILLKASRKMKFEKICNAIRKEM